MEKNEQIAIIAIITAASLIVALITFANTSQPEKKYPDLVKRMEIYKQDYPEFAGYIDYNRETFRDTFCEYNSEQCFHEPYQTEVNSQLDELYPMPNDFVGIKNMLSDGLIKYSSDVITNDYWLQPEWETNYNLGIGAVQGYQFGRYPMWCIFPFPSTHVIEIYKQNKTEIQNTTIPIWVKSMRLTDKITGFKMSVVYPEYENFEGSSGMAYQPFEVNQNVNIAERYIKMEINSSSNRIVGPNFPVYHVATEPKYKLQITNIISVDSSIPAGDYVIGINFGSPDKEFSEQQYLNFGQTQYLDPYSGILTCNIRGFRLFVRIYD